MPQPRLRVVPAALTPLLFLGLIGCASSPGGAANVAEPPASTAAEPAKEPSPSEAPPAAAAIFSGDQADRGEALFDDVCSACHTTSEFRGRAFLRNWGRRTVYSFFRTVRSTMPDDDPGGLEEQAYLDVVSYVLRMNGHQPGATELMDDSPLRQLRVDPEATSE